MHDPSQRGIPPHVLAHPLLSCIALGTVLICARCMYRVFCVSNTMDPRSLRERGCPMWQVSCAPPQAPIIHMRTISSKCPPVCHAVGDSLAACQASRVKKRKEQKRGREKAKVSRRVLGPLAHRSEHVFSTPANLLREAASSWLEHLIWPRLQRAWHSAVTCEFLLFPLLSDT